MDNFILGGIIVALLVFIYIKDKEHTKDRRQLINGVLSKNSVEFSHAEAILQTVEKEEKKVVEPDFVNEAQLSDEEFLEAVKKTNE